MQNDLIGKATFSEVYRFLKGKPDSHVFQCFKSLFGVALLFFPALIGGKIVGAVLNMVLINGLATGATLAGAGVGALVSRAAGDAFTLFNGKSHGDYATRYDQMQIAQILLVYAAYFDTISQCLPDENGEIALSPDDQPKTVFPSIRTYATIKAGWRCIRRTIAGRMMYQVNSGQISGGMGGVATDRKAERDGNNGGDRGGRI